MANEQGGHVIYGIAESGERPFQVAERVADGFTASDGVSREWLLQVLSSAIQPPLTDLDAVDVPLDEARTRFAIVVLVPQARGRARQTSDHLFWRRDAQ